MESRLNPVIEAYFAMSNAGDAKAFLECFEADAVVVDESHTHRGAEEIGGWLQHTRREYDFHATIASFIGEGDEWAVKCSVSGTFPGSPADISYRFKLTKSKITNLMIE